MKGKSPVSVSNTKSPNSPVLLSAAAATPAITSIDSPNSSVSSSTSARPVHKDSPLVLGEYEEYTRLQTAAANIIRLIPDVEKRMRMLNQIDVPYFETNSSTEIAGRGRLLESSLFKLINNEGVLITGNHIRFIGLDLLAGESRPQEKLVSIEGITEQLEQRAQELRIQQDIAWKLPDDNASYYVPRESYEKDMVDYFGTDKSVQRTMVVNAGLGGVGKTQLATYYAHHEKKAYEFKLWFSASTREQLILKYRTFALEKELISTDAKPEEIIKAVRDWLTKHTGWLIVFDNAADEAMLNEFLPSNGGDILITTRWQGWASHYKKIDVGVMTEPEAIELLKKSIDPEKHREFTTEEEVALKSLAKKLGFLPLALAQAGAYIKSFKGHISIADYKQLFDKFKAALLLDTRFPKGQDHEPVAVTWHITLEALKEECPKAIQLLEALSFLDPTSIPYFLIEQFSQQQGTVSWTDAEREAAMRASVSYSLLQRSKDGQVCNIHTLVQSVIVAGLSINDQQSCLMRWMNGINQLHADADENKPLLVEQRENQLLAHSNSLLNYIKEDCCFNAELKKALFYENISNIYFKLSNSQKQKELLEEALKIKSAYYDRKNLDMATTLGNLATAFGNLGSDQKKKELLEEVLGINEAYDGRAHWQTARTLNNLATTYGALGNHQKKQELLKEAVGIEVAYYGRGHWQTANALDNLANAYGALGDCKEKKKLLEEVLEINISHYGRGHWRTANTLKNLANACGTLGDNKRKQKLLEEVLDIESNHYGQEHWQTACTLGNLATACGQLGDDQKKKELLEEALDIQVAHYGRKHKQTASTLHNLANAYVVLGDNKRAKELLKEALDILDAHYGQGHWQTANALGDLANVYRNLKDYKKNKELLEEMLGMKVAHYGRGHAQTASTLCNLAIAYGALEDHKKKKELLEEALGIQNGQEHWQTAKILNNLAAAYGALGNDKKGKELLEEALELEIAHYGLGYWKVGITAFNLARAHLKLGELKLAYEIMEYAYHCLLSHPLHSAYSLTQEAKRWLTTAEPWISSQIESQNSSVSRRNQPRLFTSSSAVKMSISSTELKSLQSQITQKTTEAMTYYRAHDYEKALVLWQNALELAQCIPKEDYSNFHDELAVLHVNIGTAHKQLSHHDEAIRSFKQSIALREEKHGLNCPEAQKSRDKLAEVERLASVSKQDCNPLVKASRFFTGTDKSLSIKSREGLKNEAKLTRVLEQYLPAGLTLGKAHGQGDCFFDALAQCLNQMNNTDINTDKYLRMLCHDYYGKNKALVDQLNIKNYGGIDKHDDYSMVQYTVEECEKHFHGRSPIWGRPYVEGIMLCKQLNLRGLCIIELLEHPETKQPIPSFHWVNQESYTSINEQEAKERLSNLEIPTLVVEQNSLHFVPLLPASVILEPSEEYLSAAMN